MAASCHISTNLLCVVMIISTLNYSSIKMREKEEAEKKRKAAEKAQEEREKAMEKEQARYTTPSRAQGTQTELGVATEFSG
jgi:hypothetical protein